MADGNLPLLLDVRQQLLSYVAEQRRVKLSVPPAVELFKVPVGHKHMLHRV
jgi:hypothetical protein